MSENAEGPTRPAGTVLSARRPGTLELRIGELAALCETTPRTIRYYEQLGLLEPRGQREAGKHRTYDEADLERLQSLLRLKDVLGLTLEELKAIVEADDARAALRAEWAQEPPPARRIEILRESLGHIEAQLELVRRRRAEIDSLEAELRDKRVLVRRRLGELDGA